MSSSDPELDMSNREAAGTIAAMLSSAGFSVAKEELPAKPGKVNIIAHAGPVQPGAGLILAGHSDTVPAAEWETDPFAMREQDGRLHGLGACDMKGFFAALCEALPEIDLGTLKRPLKVWATANEECGMHGAQALHSAERAAMVLLGEPTELVPGCAHKGDIVGKLVCQGKAGHASRPAAGANAIDGIHLILARLCAWRDGELAANVNDAFDPPHETLSFGIVKGGDAPNRICARCELHFDCRLLPGSKPDAYFAKILAIAQDAITAAAVPGLSVTMERMEKGLGALQTSPQAPIVRLASEIAQQEPIALSFATEAPYYSALGMDVAILGAGSIAQAHQPEEYIAIEQIDRLSAMLIALVARECT